MVRSTLHLPAAMAPNDLRFRSRRILLRQRTSGDPTLALLLWSDGSTVSASDKRRPAVNTGTFTMTRGESVGVRGAPDTVNTEPDRAAFLARIPVNIKRGVFEDVLSTFTPVFAARPAGGCSNNFGLPPTLHLAAPVAPGFYLAGLCAFPVQPLFRFISR